MKKYKNIIFSSLCCFVLLGLVSCKDEIVIKDVPSILFPTKTLLVDLNQATQPELIAVVNSLTGLKSVTTYLVRTGGIVEKIDREVTTFFNPTSYSINMKPVYSDDIIAFRVVVVDIADQTTTEDLPIVVTTLKGAPKVVFYDENENLIQTFDFIESSQMKKIKVSISAQEPLHSLLLKQLVNGVENIVQLELGKDTLIFDNEIFNYDFYLNDIPNYTLPEGITAFRIYTASGPLSKFKKSTGMLSVNFVKYYPEIFVNENEDSYNGVSVNATIKTSGHILSTPGILSIKITPVDNLGNDLSDVRIIPILNVNNETFEESFTASTNLSQIRIVATDVNGNTTTKIQRIYVGFKYYSIEASIPGTSSSLPDVGPGAFFSASNGRVYSSCDAKDIYKDIDFFFAPYTTYTKITICRLDITGKTVGTCSPTTWSNDKKLYDMYISNQITRSNFDQATISDIVSSTGVLSLAGKVVYMTTTAYDVPAESVALYTTTINNVQKKVLIAYDRLISKSTDGKEATFIIKVKVEI